MNLLQSRCVLVAIHRLFSSVFSSLRFKNFRYFWIGQCVSVIGTWMQRTAQTWLALKLTHSPFLVGLLTASQFIPIVIFSLPAGTIIDRVDKKKLLLWTQFGFLLLGVNLTLLTFFNVVQYWEVLVNAFIYGCLQSLDTPTRQSFVIDLVGQKDLLNGISLNSTIMNLAKIAGPAVAGLVIVKFGTTFCFFIDTVSYIAVLLGLFLIKIKPKKQESNNRKDKKRTNLRRDILEGLRYIKENADIRLTALLMIIVCTLAYNNNVIIPVYAKNVLNQGAQGYSNLLSATGIGSLIAAILMAYLARFGINKKLYLGVCLCTCFLQAAMLLVHSFSPAVLVMIGIGFCNMVFLNQSNAAFQLSVPDHLRGRLMSVYVLLNQGTTPLGSLYSGGVMDLTSGIWVFPSCGILALVLLSVLFVKNHNYLKEWTKE